MAKMGVVFIGSLCSGVPRSLKLFNCTVCNEPIFSWEWFEYKKCLECSDSKLKEFM